MYGVVRIMIEELYRLPKGLSIRWTGYNFRDGLHNARELNRHQWGVPDERNRQVSTTVTLAAKIAKGCSRGQMRRSKEDLRSRASFVVAHTILLLLILLVLGLEVSSLPVPLAVFTTSGLTFLEGFVLCKANVAVLPPRRCDRMGKIDCCGNG